MMSKKQSLKSLNLKIQQLKGTVLDFQNDLDNENLPLKSYGASKSFGLSSDKGKKILVYVFWYRLFYRKAEDIRHEGKDFLMDHFDLPDAYISLDIVTWMGKGVEPISDIPGIKAMFKSYNNVPVANIDYGGKMQITQMWGLDAIKLIDIFDLIRENLVSEVEFLETKSNKVGMKKRLSEIEGDLYELRQSANMLLEKKIKTDKEAAILIVALVIAAIIIIGYFYVSS